MCLKQKAQIKCAQLPHHLFKALTRSMDIKACLLKKQAQMSEGIRYSRSIF